MNTPVNFELAKLLKEKRFDELCHSYVNINDENLIPQVSYGKNSFFPRGRVFLPTIAQVVMWLYEKHALWVIVGFSGDETCYSMITNKICDVRWNNKGFKSPTEAYEAAIKYTLNNLI